MRMSMRRFTRLTNGFSKKVENLGHAVALHFMHYNFCGIHQTLRVTPAMAAGLADHVWELSELIALMPKPIAKAGDASSGPPRPRSDTIALRSAALQHGAMKNLSWIVLILADFCIPFLGAGCSTGPCGSGSHPYGACPGETLPNSCPGESDGSQPCPCPTPGATAGVSGGLYVCQGGIWTAESDAATQQNSD
jgi:hypothetical protein